MLSHRLIEEDFFESVVRCAVSDLREKARYVNKSRSEEGENGKYR